MNRLFLAAALFVTAAGAYGAETGSWYIGAGLGQSSFGDCPATCEERQEAYTVFAGYRLSRHLAIEGGYVDLGKVTVTSGAPFRQSKPRGGALQVVGMWPLAERFSILAKLGVIYGDSKVSGAAPTHNDKGTQLAWGLGAQYDFGRDWMVRLGWDRYRFKASGGNTDIDAAMIVFMTTY